MATVNITDESASMHPAQQALYNNLLAKLKALATLSNSLDAAMAAVNTQLTQLTGVTIPGLTSANDSRYLSKTKADTTAYNLSVAPATSMGQAATLAQIFNGITRPYRIFYNVGTNAVGATVPTGMAPAVADIYGLGQVWGIRSISIKTIVAPTLATTIVIKSGSTVVFTKTLALVGVPVVGGLADLLAGSVLPTDVVLPATLTATASAGTFEIIVDGVLKVAT